MVIRKCELWTICLKDPNHFRLLLKVVRLFDINGRFRFVTFDELPDHYRNITSWNVLVYQGSNCYFNRDATDLILSEVVLLKKMPRVFQRLINSNASL
jgi:hypothetical protein